jgi:hypothetical protein
MVSITDFQGTAISQGLTPIMNIRNSALFYVLQMEEPSYMQYLSRHLYVAMFWCLGECERDMGHISVYIIHMQLSLTEDVVALLLNGKAGVEDLRWLVVHWL